MKLTKKETRSLICIFAIFIGLITLIFLCLPNREKKIEEVKKEETHASTGFTSIQEYNEKDRIYYGVNSRRGVELNNGTIYKITADTKFMPVQMAFGIPRGTYWRHFNC